jgi:sulfatase maturation enzyme AslB (radical SAM superfamily)
MPQSIRFLQIEPTTRCNFTCGFCAGRHMPQEDMPLADFCAHIDRCEGLTHLELQGEGEPLMHPDFFAMLDYALQKHPGLSVSIITNGSLFTPERVEALLQRPISSLLVSLESADPAEFQRIRGGSLARVARGLSALQTQKQRLGRTLPVGLAVTLTQDTYRELPAIGAFYREHQLDGGILLQALQPMAAYAQYYNPYWQGQRLAPADYQALQQCIASDHPLRSHILAFAQTPHFYRSLYAEAAQAGPGCPWLQAGLFIAVSGIACSCCFIKDAPGQGLGLALTDWPDVLARRQQMAEQLQRGQLPNPCRDCDIARQLLARTQVQPQPQS